MPVHKCSQCEYQSPKKSNLDRHMTTHNNRIKVNKKPSSIVKNPGSILVESNNGNTYVCSFCKNKYSTAGNLAKHKKSCNDKIKLEDKVKELERIVDAKDDMIFILKEDNTHLKSLVNTAGAVIKTSMSTMSYVIKNYEDAPALAPLKNYSAIHYKQTKTEFVEDLICHYKHKLLGGFIGDFIIKTYKKDDPTKQSLWNSDTTRLTYVIRELYDKKIDWRVDKQGIKIIKYVVEPVLNYVDKTIRDYIKNFDTNYDVCSAREAEKKMLKLTHANEILTKIEDKILCDDIMRYIAPYFYLSKDDSPTAVLAEK